MPCLATPATRSRAAASGPEGLGARRASGAPDVIVLDVYMPEMDGFEVVERLKQDPATAPAPVIFLTAEPPTDDLVVRGLELGAYDFLSKGCSRAELLARVGVMARIKRGNDELSAIARISDTLIQSLDPEELVRRFVRPGRRGLPRRRRAAGLLAARRGAESQRGGAGLDAERPALPTRSPRALLEPPGRGDGPGDRRIGDCAAPARRARLRRHRLRVGARRAGRARRGRPPTLLAVLSRAAAGFARGSDAPLLELLARQATIALDNAMLHAHTREQARTMEEPGGGSWSAPCPSARASSPP